MKCISLAIDNFFGIGHADLALDDKGLVLVQGVNVDDPSASSNGSGKSTIAEALFWCNYGETARGLPADKVVNRKTGKDCQVTATWLEDDGTKHVVSRWRKKNVGGKRSGCSLVTINTDGTEISRTGGTDKLTQVEIDKALGCTEEVFTAAVYAAQKKLPDLPSKTDTELKTLIEEASGVNTLVKAYAIARDKLKSAENNLDRWRLEHVHLERSVTDTQTRIDDLKVREGAYEKEKRAKLVGLADTVKSEVEAGRRHKAIRDDINVPNVTAAIAKLDERIASVHAEQEAESALVTQESAANSKVTLSKANYNRVVDEARMQRSRVDNIKARVGTPCGECGKPYCEDDLDGASDLATKKLRELVAQAREIKEDLDRYEKDALQVTQELAEHRSKRTDIRATVEERRRLAEALVTRQRADDALTSHSNAAQRAKAQHDALKAESNPFVTLLEKAHKELSDMLGKYRASEEAGVECERRVMVCKDVVKVFGPAGVRAHILDNVTPFLNDRTADYLGTLSDGQISATWSTLSINAKGEPVEKFNIDVNKIGDADCFAGLSGGEQKKVQMATALALQDLVASRATKPIGIWVGDEIDDALDEPGLERLMNVLEQKARDRGTVLVISHNALNDWIRETVTVTRKDKDSVITGCLVPA